MIGVVVPVRDRRENLSLLLRSLEQQTTADFGVVIADDGSTDGTREMIVCRARTPTWDGRLSWVGCGPNQGVRTGRARNIGAANLPPEATLLIMLDSDLILPPEAIAGFAAARERHPSEVLLGIVNWLPPLDNARIRVAVETGDLNPLLALVPPGPPRRVEGTFIGPELRAELCVRAAGQAVPLRPEWALPLNSAWPLAVYWSIGGFDETMTGYGYQDMDLGARAAAVGVACVACPDLLALHVWHPKPRVAMIQNQVNLDRYLRRHGPNRVVEADVDWQLWWHYHADRGGVVARQDGRLWALSGDRRHRLALPDATWLRQLGHCAQADEKLPPAVLEAAADHGAASLAGSGPGG